MAISPADDSCLHDEQEQMQIISLRNLQMVENNAAATAAFDDDAGLEEDLKALRARVAALQDEDDVLPAESWDWAVGVEAVAQHAVERMAQEEAAIQQALSSRRSGEAAAAALRAEAARVGELRGYAEDVAAAERRVRKADLRKLAADAETGSYSHILTLTHEELTTAAKPEFEFLAVATEEWMASLAARLNRGVAEFADTPGEEKFVVAMRMEAAKAEEARSAIASYRAAAGNLLPPAAGDQMEQD